MYRVVVGIYGTLYQGESEIDALKSFAHWSEHSSGYNEDTCVELWKDERIIDTTSSHEQVYNLPHTD